MARLFRLFRFSSYFVLLVVTAQAALAQASLQCQMRPASLVAMLHCFRPLLVFSPSASDPRLKEQTHIPDAAADDMMDRFVMLTPIVQHPKLYVTPLDTPYIVLRESEMQFIRKEFHVPLDQFEVILLDEDGHIRLRSDMPIRITPLNRLIDTIPERQIEMKRRGAN